MSNISNRTIADMLDHIGSVTRAQNKVYNDVTTDAFDILLREHNPDDLDAGVDAANAVDTSLAAGTAIGSEWGRLIAWLTTRAVNAGSPSLDALLTTRGVRASQSFNQKVMLASRGSALSAANVFPDTAITLQTFLKGSSDIQTTGDVLPSTISLARIIANVVSSTETGNAWTINVTAQMSDAANYTFVATIPDNITSGIVNLLELSCNPTTANIAGQKLVHVSSTGGILTDRVVMLVDPAFTTALTTDLAYGTANTFSIDPSQVGYFEPGDAVTIDDDDSSPTSDRTIVDIDYRTGLVTLSGADLTTPGYTVAQHAIIFFTTPKAEGYGRVEIATVDTFVADTSITFDSNLGHSYGVSAKVYPLVTGVTTMVTASYGTTGDEVEIQTQADRLINRLNTSLSI